MAHTPVLHTTLNTTELATAINEAIETSINKIEKQTPPTHWGPTLQLNTSHVYPALSGALQKTASLGNSVTASTASRARVTTSNIPEHHVPLPPNRLFVPMAVAGGMGPLATVDLQMKLFKAGERKLNEIAQETGKQVTDQDHPGVISFNLGHMIQDRTAYLNSFQGDRNDAQAWREHLLKPVPENPFWGALEVCKAAKAAGAHFIVFPCNTWHAWFEVMAEKIKLPMLHIAEATVLSLQKAEPKMPEAPKIGLIATTGTVNSQLYQKAGERMEALGCPKITWVLPKPESQDKAMKDIYDGVKAGNMELGAKLLDEVAHDVINDGANAFFDACTEVNPAIGDISYPVPQVDAATALAETAVRLSMALAKLERKFS